MVCGDIMTMPGLPKVPSADKIDIDAQGRWGCSDPRGARGDDPARR